MAQAHISWFLLFSRCWLDSLWCKLNFDCFLLNFTNLQMVGMGSVHMRVRRKWWHVMFFKFFYLCICMRNITLCGREWSCVRTYLSCVIFRSPIWVCECSGAFYVCEKAHLLNHVCIIILLFEVHVLFHMCEWVCVRRYTP